MHRAKNGKFFELLFLRSNFLKSFFVDFCFLKLSIVLAHYFSKKFEIKNFSVNRK